MMTPELRSEIESKLSLHCNEAVKISGINSLSGGCINDALKITTRQDQHWFLKTNRRSSLPMFDSERTGLESLRDSKSFRIPEVIAVGTTSEQAYLLLEFIPLRPAGTQEFSLEMARRLAQLHTTSASEFGFVTDNFLGATPQPNPSTRNWVEFWNTYRMEHQLRLANDKGFGGALQELGRRLMNRMEDWLTNDEESPALIHGDLWSGNYFVDESGCPVLLDPAPYFASREAEFGMTTLFGGFDDRFYAAYNEMMPMPDGSENRIAIYRLYHLLNHLNLFGSSYLDGCLQILKKYA